MKKRLTSDLGLKILAFLIASFMWLLVVNIDDPVTDRTFTGIAVTVVNEEVVTDSNRTYQIVDDTQEVSVVVTAKRSVLNNIRSRNIVAQADMRELSLGTQVPIEVTVRGYDVNEAYANPRNLQVQIDEEAKNTFPITPTTSGTVREGYVLGQVTADPERVTFRGPKTVIDSISRVTAEADVSGLSDNKTVEARLVLYDANNNVIDQTLLANNLGEDGVNVEVELYSIKSVPIEIDTTSITAADGYQIGDITIEPQSVRVTGSEEDLEDLLEIEIPASELDASGLTERTVRTIDISDYIPEDIVLVDENASNVVVTIPVEQPGAHSFEISTSSIIVNNLADNLKVNYGTTVDLEVQVKGPSEALEVFSIAQKASIDLKDYTRAGTYEVPVDITLPEDCTLVNDVKVEVILEEN